MKTFLRFRRALLTIRQNNPLRNLRASGALPLRYQLWLGALLVLLCVRHAGAASVTLDDHGTAPCYLYVYDHRGDSVTVHVTVVTGSVWRHDDTGSYFDLRVGDAAGHQVHSGMHVALGAPAGTVVDEFDFVQPYPFCEYPPGTTNKRAFGFPVKCYIADNIETRGDATGSGLVMTFTDSGDGGYSGSGLGIDKTSPAQVWTIYDGPITPAEHLTNHDAKTGGNQCSLSPPDPMALYSIHSMLLSLNIEDRPLRYTPPRGPAIDFTVTYNQREKEQPATFDYSNLGPKWTFNWLGYVTDWHSIDPVTFEPNVTNFLFTSVYMPGGGTQSYVADGSTNSFFPDPQTHAVLVRTGQDSYEERFPDGSIRIFARPDGSTTANPGNRKVFLTKLSDPAGNSVTIGHDSNFRVSTLTDALGQVTTVFYELAADPLKITKVTDPFGRFATFEYYEDGKLKKIIDEIGIESQFTYSSGTDSIDSLTTPYGTTTFASGQSGANRWIEITGPPPLLGKERVEYRDNAPGIGGMDPANLVPSGFTNAGLDVANTFYWDKKATLMYPPSGGAYTNARMTHWAITPTGEVSGVVASKKAPLENRIWFKYAGQSDTNHTGPSANPIQVARVLADESTQLSQYEYNSLGRTTKSIDPTGRVLSYIYDSNQIDLLEVRQTTGANNELVLKFQDYVLHKPTTEIDAAGQSTTYTYNASGQILTRTNAKYETTTYAYGGTVPAGYPASITSPPFNNVSAVTRFGYDSFKRVRTVTNEADQFTVTTDYDKLDRKTQVTYPDGTTDQFVYTDDERGMALDLTASKDRLGRWTYRNYNANRQMDSMTDPANRTMVYDWCSCGSLRGITDPNGNVTTFNRDLQGRVYQKVFADGTTINYLYEGQTAPNTAGATSRLKSSTDALSRRTNYSYFVDDNISQVSYTDTSGNPLSPSTPSVSYGYDPNYNRIATMTDGTGLTSYAYYPIASPPALGAGRLQTVNGPLDNDTIAFTYDELGRTLSQSINGVAEIVAYDSLGRLKTTDNALGHFSRAYYTVTPRLQTLTYPNEQTANYTYFGNMDDRRLQTLQNLASGTVNLSKFDYSYDDEGQIKSWSSLLGGTSSGRWFEYDDAQQLLSARNASEPGFATLMNDYQYDNAANRTGDSISNPQGQTGNGTLRDYIPNDVNQIESFSTQDGGSPISIDVVLLHDAAGNLTDDGNGRTFEWDAANRLRAINYGSQRSEFTYDGLSRRVRIVEKNGGAVTSTKNFAWIGTGIAQERDASNAITRRYFAEGEQRAVAGTKGLQKYFYSRDHLGSIRELTNSTGAVQARYEYDPYGNRTKLSGTLDVDFGYTGHYHHAPSGLNLTLYRAYNPTLGRWISRDPIGEKSGFNLYAYVSSSPIVYSDSLGLFDKDVHAGTLGQIYGTYTWVRDLGLSGPAARIIARANIGTDSGVTGPWPWPFSSTLEGRARHFDIPLGGDDSRDAWAWTEMRNALDLWPTDKCAAYNALGRGLHSIQDYFAHGDWDNEMFPVTPHPAWMDDWAGRSDVHGPVERATKAYLQYFLNSIDR